MEVAIIGGVGEAAAAEETGASHITRTMEPTIPLTCPALPGGERMTAAVEGASQARVASQASRARAAREAREASLEGAGAVASRVNDSGGILGIESFVNIRDMRRLVKIHDLGWLHKSKRLAGVVRRLGK